MTLPRSSSAKPLVLPSGEYSELTLLKDFRKLIYGPVQSRRLGQSLGINLLGKKKLCTFDCPYCELGKTEVRLSRIREDAEFPSIDQVMKELSQRMLQLLLNGTPMDRMTVSGNGEPTMHPQFAEFVEQLIAFRDEKYPSLKITLLTSGTQFNQRKILSAAEQLDEIVIKIDAGNDKMLKAINSPLLRTSITKLVGSLRDVKKTIVQSMFLQGRIDNTTTIEVDDWIEVVGLVGPLEVQIYSLDRVPAESGLIKVSEEVLDIIASRLSRKVQAKIKVFG